MRDERHTFIVEQLKIMMQDMEDSYQRKEIIREDIKRQHDELSRMVSSLPEDFIGLDWMMKNIKEQERLLVEMEQASKSSRRYIDQCLKSSESITYAIDLHAQGVLSDEEVQDVIQMEAEIIEAYNLEYQGEQ